MKHLSHNFELKALAEDGTFEGIAAVFGNRDLGGDVIEEGAFTATLAAKQGKRFPLLWQHDSKEAIGAVIAAETKAGLVVKGKLSLAVGKAREAYELLKDGAISGLSIGYETVKEKVAGSTRYLKEVRLWEVSLVTFPMNELAQVTGVKAAEADWSPVIEALGRFNAELRKGIR